MNIAQLHSHESPFALWMLVGQTEPLALWHYLDMVLHLVSRWRFVQRRIVHPLVVFMVE